MFESALSGYKDKGIKQGGKHAALKKRSTLSKVYRLKSVLF